MKKWLIIILIVPAQLFAQLPKDSLWRVWNNKTLPDSVRFEAYDVFIHEHFVKSSPDSAMNLANNMLNKAEANSLILYTGKALLIKSSAQSVLGEFNLAISSADSALKIFEELDHKPGVFRSLVNSMLAYRKAGDYGNALKVGKRAQAMAEQQNDKKWLAETLTLFSGVYWGMGKSEQALDMVEKSLKLYEELDYKPGIARNLNGVGIHNQEIGNYDKALEALTKSLALHRELGDRQLESYNLNNIGMVYRDLEEHDKALDYLFQSVAIKNEIGDSWGGAASKLLIGETYNLKQEHNKAVKWCTKSVETLEKINTLHYLDRACSCLHVAYKKLNQNTKALEYLEKFLAIKDSLNTEKYDRQMQQMEMERQAIADSLSLAREEEMRLEIIQQEQAAKDRRNRLQISGVIILVLLLGSIIALSGKVNMKPSVAGGLIFIFFILLFEFILVVTDPWVDEWSDGEVAVKLGINSAFALIVFFGHQFFEGRLKRALIKTRKKERQKQADRF